MKLQTNVGIEKLFMKACIRSVAHKREDGRFDNKYHELISAADSARVVALREALYALGYTTEMVSDMADVAEKAFCANGKDVEAAAEYIEMSRHHRSVSKMGSPCR